MQTLALYLCISEKKVASPDPKWSFVICSCVIRSTSEEMSSFFGWLIQYHDQEPILKCKKLGQSEEKKNNSVGKPITVWKQKYKNSWLMFIKRPPCCNYSNIMTLRFTHFMYNKKLRHKLPASFLIRDTKPIFKRFQ